MVIKWWDFISNFKLYFQFIKILAIFSAKFELVVRFCCSQESSNRNPEGNFTQRSSWRKTALSNRKSTTVISLRLKLATLTARCKQCLPLAKLNIIYTLERIHLPASYLCIRYSMASGAVWRLADGKLLYKQGQRIIQGRAECDSHC